MPLPTRCMVGSPVPLCQSMTNSHDETGKYKAHQTTRNVRSANVEISADAKKGPVDNCIREENGSCFVILTVHGNRHAMLSGVCGKVSTCTCVAVAASPHGSLLPAKIGR